MVEKPNKVQAAMMIGIIFGVISSIPFIGWLNVCCCLWAIIAGLLAARRLINRSPVFPVTTGDGAVVGVITGAIIAGVYLVIGVPLHLLFKEMFISFFRWIADLTNDPKARTQIEQMIRQMEDQPLAAQIASGLFNWLLFSVLAIGFATLGGIIGVAMFEKRKGQPPAPPFGPQGYPPQGPPPGQPPYGAGDRPPY